MKGSRPLGDQILVKRVKEEERTKGGIIIPDTARKSRKKAKSSPSARANVTTTAS